MQVQGTRPYRLAPPLPVLESSLPDHLLSADTRECSRRRRRSPCRAREPAGSDFAGGVRSACRHPLRRARPGSPTLTREVPHPPTRRRSARRPRSARALERSRRRALPVGQDRPSRSPTPFAGRPSEGTPPRGARQGSFVEWTTASRRSRAPRASAGHELSEPPVVPDGDAPRQAFRVGRTRSRERRRTAASASVETSTLTQPSSTRTGKVSTGWKAGSVSAAPVVMSKRAP